MHQHALDAFVAQTANAETSPQRVIFALAGLCLLVEHEKTGRQIQQAHARLARYRDAWPQIELPVETAALSAADVLNVPEGEGRDAIVREWCAAVWSSQRSNHSAIRNYLRQHGEG